MWLSGAERAQFELFSNTIIRLGRKTSQACRLAFEAALSKLGLVDRTDPATMAVAKLRPG
jgi:hypothetical protein